MIQTFQLSKRYGAFWAVKELNLDIRPGEIFGFLGINGAGKTTTLRMMAGVLLPTSGSVKICGFDLAEHPRLAKQIIGYIPDRPYIYPKLTGREFLYFVCDLYRVPDSEVDKRIDELLGQYLLTDWQDELVESYSHGMKQRLATCAALVHRPKVLIVDEPMVGLDPHGAKFLKKSLRSYADSGVSVLLSTHSLNVAEEVSDRLAIIHRGEIITTGTLSEIRAQAGVAQQHDLEEIFLEITAEQDEEPVAEPTTPPLA